MKTLLLVTAIVLLSSTARADDATGILTALRNPEGALADILRPETNSSLASLGEKITQLGDEIRETRSIKVKFSNGPVNTNANLTIALSN